VRGLFRVRTSLAVVTGMQRVLGYVPRTTRWCRLATFAAVSWTAVACDSAEVGSPPTSLVEPSVGSAAPGTESAAVGTATAASSSARSVLDDLLVDFAGDRDGGVAVLVAHDGIATTAATGVANDAGDEITPETPFRVGSISKPFVATMVLQLVDEGRVALDEPLSTYLPDTPIGAAVTIRALLSHRSGLPNYTDVGSTLDDALANRSRTFSPDEILASVAAIPPDEPDQHFAYSNTNYILLGQLIEQLDATDLNTSLRQRITEPLKLDVTRFATGSDPAPAGVAAGWSPGVLDGDRDADYTSIASGAWAAGALVSTVGELATFLHALFAGELITARSLTEMTATGADGYGLGLFIASFDRGRTGYGHNGGIFGYTATMAIHPESGDTVVVATNNDRLVADQLAAQIITSW
jgi:D-alanyl-D-alanine carboxypeptidase